MELAVEACRIWRTVGLCTSRQMLSPSTTEYSDDIVFDEFKKITSDDIVYHWHDT